MGARQSRKARPSRSLSDALNEIHRLDGNSYQTPDPLAVLSREQRKLLRKRARDPAALWRLGSMSHPELYDNFDDSAAAAAPRAQPAARAAWLPNGRGNQMLALGNQTPSTTTVAASGISGGSSRDSAIGVADGCFGCQCQACSRAHDTAPSASHCHCASCVFWPPTALSHEYLDGANLESSCDCGSGILPPGYGESRPSSRAAQSHRARRPASRRGRQQQRASVATVHAHMPASAETSGVSGRHSTTRKQPPPSTNTGDHLQAETGQNSSANDSGLQREGLRNNHLHGVSGQQHQDQRTSSPRARESRSDRLEIAAHNVNIGLEHESRRHEHQTQDPQVASSRLSTMSHLIQARVQRGLAYSDEERRQLKLTGLLPAAHQDMRLQMKVVINFLNNCCKDELSKYTYLRQLKDFNEHLFYYTLGANVEQLMPIVYTPTVGLACQKFSHIFMRPRGLFITSNDLGRVKSILCNWPEKDVRVIVVTDGERILGLGDLGANGMGICIGKLSLYTALAGIPPKNVLPVCLDVGTGNQTNLDDPFYIGLRQPRVRGQKYDQLVEEFMQSAVELWGRSCLIQFEDFANSTAFSLLQAYRDRYCTFNDDIQGTASVCLAGLVSAAKRIDRKLSTCSYLFYGAGEANLGTANLLVMAMTEEGLSSDEAKTRIWLVDSKGLVVSSRQDLSGHKRAFARQDGSPQIKELEEIVKHSRPTAIIGASAQAGAFNESICRLMAEINEQPIIFALSNPTSKAECTAKQAYEWTDGKCVFASGSPFDPVEHNGRTYITGQGNNAYIFPGVGLAAVAAHTHSIPEEVFLVAARALSDQLEAEDVNVGLVYPRLTKIRECTLKIATRVLEYFYSERLATYRPEPSDKMEFLKSIQYDTSYESEPLAA